MSESNVHRRVKLLMSQQRWGMAEDELGRMLAEDANNAWPVAMLAMCRLRLGKEKEALELADRAVGMAPDESYVFHVRAKALIYNGKLDDAVRQLREALRIDPNDPDYFELLSRLNGVLNRSEKAIAAANEGLSRDPEHNGCLVALADQFARKGRLAEAEETLRRALENNPEDGEAFSLLGDVSLRQGRTTEARQFFEEALRLEPGNRDAEKGFLDAGRMATGIWRRLLPLLLLGDRLSDDQPIVGRFMMGVGVCVLMGLVHEIPAARPIFVPLAVILVPALLLMMLGRPIMNLRMRRDRLRWFSLTWLERMNAQSLVFGVPWALAMIGLGGITGLRDPVFAAALSSFLPVPPLAALLTRPSDFARKRLSILAGIGVAACAAIIGAQWAGWSSLKWIVITVIFFGVNLVAVTALSLKTEDGLDI